MWNNSQFMFFVYIFTRTSCNQVRGDLQNIRMFFPSSNSSSTTCTVYSQSYERQQPFYYCSSGGKNTQVAHVKWSVPNISTEIKINS